MIKDMHIYIYIDTKMTYIRKNNYRRKQKEHTKIRNKTIRKSNKKEE